MSTVDFVVEVMRCWGVRREVWRRYGLGMRHDPWRRKVLTGNIFVYGYHTSWADAMAHALAFSEQSGGLKWEAKKAHQRLPSPCVGSKEEKVTRRAKIFTRDYVYEDATGEDGREWVITYITHEEGWVRYDAPVPCEAGWREALWRARKWIVWGVKTGKGDYPIRPDSGGAHRWY